MELRVASQRRRHLANGILMISKSMCKLNGDPSKFRSHVTQKLGQISKICSVQKLDIVP